MTAINSGDQTQHYAELREQAERAGQGLDVEALISARMEQVARAEKAEAAIARVRDTCGFKQGCQFHNDSWNRGWDAALAWVESALEGDSDE